MAKYFLIDREDLKDQKIFPFMLYIYNPITNRYSPFLNPNAPLTSDKDQFLNYLLERGGFIAIDRRQKNTFLNEFQYNENDFPGLKEKSLDTLEKSQKMYLEILKMKIEKEGKFNFQQEFKNAIQNDNFMPLIEQTRLEVSCFSVHLSHEVSLAIYLADRLMNNDTPNNRIVAITYFLAKTCNINDQQSLSEAVCAAFLHHIGFTQIDRFHSLLPKTECFNKDFKAYKWHGILAQHLIKKCELSLNDRTLKLINEHHENAIGSGFPLAKVEKGIDILSFILGVSSNIIEQNLGLMDGIKRPINTAIFLIKNKSFMPGLETHYGTQVLNVIDTILKDDDLKNKIEKSA